MKIGSLCSGYGGLDMAVEYVFNAETVWMSDIDKASSKVIKERWQLPNLGDLNKVNWEMVEPIDILTAGYPCQPFSNAGLRKGENDPRHLWPSIEKIISLLRPSIVILENVRGHLSLGFKEVLKDLTKIGYDSRWKIVRASDAGAPHRRERLFVVAQFTDTNRVGSALVANKSTTKRNCGKSQLESKYMGKLAGHTDSEQLQADWQAPRLGRRYKTPSELQLLNPPNPLERDKLNPLFVEYMMGLPTGWVTDLDLSQAQKFKLLGNGVVPQQAELALSELC